MSAPASNSSKRNNSSNNIHAEIDPNECRSMLISFQVVQESSSKSSFLDGIDKPTVTAFLSSQTEEPFPTHWTTMGSTQMSNASSGEVTVYYHIEKLYASLVFNVFGEYANADAGTWVAQHHVCTGRIALESLLNPAANKDTPAEIEMVSQGGRKYGRISITFVIKDVKSDPKFDKGLEGQRATAMEKVRGMIAEMHKAVGTREYAADWGEFVPKFVEVVFRGMKMPVAAVLASLSNVKAKPEELNATFGWWLHLATSNCGVTETVQQNTPDDVKAELLGEIFTMMFKGLVYATDGVRVGKRGAYKFEPEDQWTPLLMFPNLARACFDCEDGMITCLQLLYAFRVGKMPATGELRVLQEHLSKYAACFALGQIRSNDDDTEDGAKPPTYILHAFPLLLDRRLLLQSSSKDVSSTTTDNLLPTILLETTNYLSSSVVAADLSQTSEKRARRYDETAKEFMDENHNDDAHKHFIVHTKAPGRRILTMQAYGLLHSIYCVDTPTNSATDAITHYHAVNTSGGVGVSMTDILLLGQQTTTKSMSNSKSRNQIHPVLEQIIDALNRESLATAINVDRHGLARHEAFQSFKPAYSVSEKDMQQLACLLCDNSPLRLPVVDPRWMWSTAAVQSGGGTRRQNRSAETTPVKQSNFLLVPACPKNADRYLVQKREPGVVESFVAQTHQVVDVDVAEWKRLDSGKKGILGLSDPTGSGPLHVHDTMLFNACPIAIVDIERKS
jgi:hypothetical protein